MNALAKLQTTTMSFVRRNARTVQFFAIPKADRQALIQESLDDQFEDAQLNAIADERADGPFVRVSLDDL